MKFLVNDAEYEIIEVGQEDFFKTEEEKKDSNFFLWGQSKFDNFKILLYKDLPVGQKRHTLYHELMHIYIKSYFTSENLQNINEEILCDISANSHDIIHKIVEDYLGGKNE